MPGSEITKRNLIRWAGRCAATAALGLLMAACGGAADNKATPGTGGATLKPGPGFDGKTISIGNIGLLSGPVAKVGLDTNAGFVAYFKVLNDKGGVNGRYPVNVVQGDNQLTNTLAVQEYNRIKGQVVMFGSVFGTPTSNAILPLAKQDQMLVGPASFEAAWVHEPNFLPVGPTYQVMAANSLNYYLTDGGGQGKRVCTLTRNDPYGNDAVEGTQYAAGKLGFTVAAAPTFVLNASDFTGQISALQTAACDAVVLAASPPEAARIIGAAAQARFTPQWIAQAAAYDPSLLATPAGDYMKQHVWVSGPPNAVGDTSVAGMNEMLAAQKASAPTAAPSFWFMLGWTQAQTATEVLKVAVTSGDLSPKGVLDASHRLPKVDSLFGTYTYGDPAKRAPVTATGLFRLDPSGVYGQVPIVVNYAPALAKDYKYPPAR